MEDEFWLCHFTLPLLLSMEGLKLSIDLFACDLDKFVLLLN